MDHFHLCPCCPRWARQAGQNMLA